MADGSAQLRALGARLKAAGPEGRGLYKELDKALTEAARSLAQEVTSAGHLMPYLPDRYAAVLAGDLGWRVTTVFGSDPRVQLRVSAREHKRKIGLLNQGTINHPVYPQGPRKRWNWKNRQTGGMRPGWFDDACRDAAPDARDKVMKAIAETARKIARG